HANAGSPSPDNALLTAFFRSLLARGQEVLLLEGLDHRLDVVRDVLADAGGRRLDGPAPDQDVLHRVVEAGLRDVDLVPVQRGIGVAVPRPGVAAQRAG